VAMGSEFFRSFAYAEDKFTPVVDVKAQQKRLYLAIFDPF
jgi:hypothetical protein